MKEPQTITELVIQHAENCADAAISAYWRDLNTRQYLYCKPGTVTVAPDNPGDGLQLVTSEHLPRNLTHPQLTGWIIDRLRRAPILTEEQALSLKA